MLKLTTAETVYAQNTMAVQRVHKNKANNYFLAQLHQIAAKCSRFWYSDLRNNCEFGYDYVFHLACVLCNAHIY